MDATYPYASTPCNCRAQRQAARRVTQMYDAALASLGLRSTQYAILFALQRPAPWSIQELAGHMVMDRTTLGRTVRPLACARPLWRAARAQFEAGFGVQQATALRGVLQAVVVAEFPNSIAS